MSIQRIARIAAIVSLVSLFAWQGAAFATTGEGHGAEAASEGGEGGHAGGHGGGHSGHSKSINWWSKDTSQPPVGWLIVDFAILFGGLYFLLRKPLSNYLVTRRTTLSSQIEEAKKIKADVDAKYSEVLKKLEQIDQFTREISDSFSSRGQAEKQRLVENAERLRATIESSTKQIVDREVTAAKAKIQAEVTGAALKIAEELLKKNLKPEDNERLIKEFVERLSELRTDGLH
jgi:F-type H+-transporting ATPase subunit b